MNAVAMHMNDEQLLNRIRDYLQTLKFAEFKIDKDVSEVSEKTKLIHFLKSKLKFVSTICLFLSGDTKRSGRNEEFKQGNHS